MWVLGLTGGMGSGKSRVAQLLARLGAAVISADEVARWVTRPCQPAYHRIVARFGPEVVLPDGTLDRRALARRVFADPEERKVLEEITHPEIRREMLRRLEELRRQPQPPPAAVLEIPLLFETGGREAYGCHQVWVVYAPEEVRLARVVARDGLTPEEVRARFRAQLPLEHKVALADVVIDNSGAWEDTERQVRAAWERLGQAGTGCQGGEG